MSERLTGAAGHCPGETMEMREMLTGAIGQSPGESKEVQRTEARPGRQATALEKPRR